MEKIEPMVINFRVEDENITSRIFLIPIAVYSQDANNITPIVMAVDTDNPGWENYVILLKQFLIEHLFQVLMKEVL
jgi:hypothetical protein